MRRLEVFVIALCLGSLPLVGCGPPDEGGSSPDATTDGGDMPDGMSDVGIDGLDDTDETGPAPSISDLTVTERPDNVLSALVELETDIDAEVRIDVVRDGEVVRTVGPTDTATAHELIVYGLRAETDYEFDVHADANDARSTRTESFATGPLPDDFPPLTVEQSSPEQAADGYRLIDLFRWNEDATSSQDDWGMAIAVDKRGEVVWYYQADHPVWDVNRLSNGNFVYNAGHEAIVEVDMTGEIVNEWDAAEDLGRELEDDTYGVHHGVDEQDDGELLTLSTEMRQIEDYAEQGETANVVGDVALQFDRDGEVTESWSMFDVLEDYRMRKRVGSTGPYWDEDYEQTTNDWTHGNAVENGDTDGTLIASLRHQDWIIKWDRETGDLLWRLGPEGDFEFEGDGEFNYHQHAPIWLDNGNLLVYDNGNARPSIEEGEQFYTRVVEYALDASSVDIEAGETGTVEQVWEYRTDPQFYAPYVGDADELPNGNILVGDGGLLSDPGACIDFDEQGGVVDQTGACISNSDVQKWARIVEVTHDEDQQEVLEVRIRDDAEENPRSYTMYRSSHIETLYPETSETE